MRIDQALASMAVQLDEVFAENAVSFADLLVRHGATDEELERELKIAELTRATERARLLAELEAWLQRGGESLQ